MPTQIIREFREVTVCRIAKNRAGGNSIQGVEMVEHQGIAPCTPAWKAGMYLSTLMLEKGGNLRIQFSHWHFDRIRFVLPDAASRRFHATRPKPQLRKPAWLPFYTGGDSSLQLGLSAFIFRLPCGQQRSITPPCESNRPPPSLRDNGRPDCAEALRG
jgi:hypothetical protein